MNIPIAVCNLLGKPGSSAGRKVVRRLRPLLLLLSAIPLVAYPLVLSDYLNVSTVSASGDQFETVTTNNESEVQIVPNAELVIVKEVVNDDGGDLVIGDFGLTTDAGTLVFGPGVTSGNITTYTSQTIYIPPGTYSLVEADLPGYVEGSWACSEGVVGNDAFDSGEVTLAFGEQTVCEISNDDITPTLTLAKTVLNDDGGDLADTDFDLSIDGTVVTNGVANSVAANTALTISELALPGYTAGTWECTDATGLTSGLPTAGVATGETVDLEPGSDVTCAITNDDIAPTLTLAKTVVNDDGGALAVGDFEISIDGSIVGTGVANTVAANTSITISELSLPGYIAGTWECTDANNLTTTLPSAGAAAGETFQLKQGSDVTCAITNDDVAPTLTLAKTLVNDDGGDLAIADFEISVDGTIVTSGVANTVAANTAITISELDLPGYTEGTWECTDANGLTTVLPSAGAALGETLQLNPGSDVTCAITNDDVAPSLTLTKTLVNDDGGALAVTDFALSIDGSIVSDGVANLVAANTPITISELDLPGYTEGVWECTDATGLTTVLPTAGVATGEALELKQGSDVTCAISNDDIAPQLTLTKTLINDNGGVSIIDDFELSIDGALVTNGVATTQLANTPITISELDLPGYTEGTWACVDAASVTTGLPVAGVATGETLQLAPGADVNCAITNDDLAPSLTLTKTLVNDDGGDAVVADFNLAIDGTAVVSGAGIPVSANTVLNISELDLPGYTEGTWSCVDSTGLTIGLPTAGTATSTDLTLAEGAIVNCSITNDDIAPTLTLAKTVLNNNGGDLAVADFEISIDGGIVTSGVANTVAANTVLNLSELDLPGYTEGTWSCVDSTGLTVGLPTAGNATSTDVTLAEGAIVNCAITNDDIAPTLTLAKTLLNDNGGDLAITDFEISIDGAVVASGFANTVAANTDITISELDLAGYTEGVWECTDATGLSAGLPTAGAAIGETFQIKQGSDVTCAITNDDIAPTLTLAKTVVNDDGGDLAIADFEISIDSTIVANGVANPVTANAVITISELDLPGYTEGTWECADTTGLTAVLPTAGVATGETLELKQGSEVVCEITNDDIAPTLTLAKTVINNNGGDLAVTDFEISVDGTIVSSGVANTVLANTAIVISELDLPGYSEGVWECTDATGLTTVLPVAGVATGETIELKQGSDVTCAIINDDVAPTLTLAKTLVNDDGGDLAIADFEISIDGSIVSSGFANTVAANTAITISELALPGYTAGTWECTDAAGLTTALPTAGAATGETIEISQGSDVTCEITNDDIAPLLTLVKTVVNDNGGGLAVSDFDISVDGVVVSSGVANPVLANTNILISELDLQPYAEGTWECVDATGLTTGLPTAGVATGETISLKQGSDVTCSITNNDLGIDLSIVKTVDDPTPNIGQTITFTLTVVNNGPDVATNASVLDIVPAGFTYVPASVSGGSSSDDTDPAGAGLGWTLNSMPVGTPFVLTFDAVVNAP